MKTKSNKGFSLLEITLVLGIGTAMAFMKFQDMKSDQENIMANTVGAQMKQMGEAVNRYISIRLTSFQRCLPVAAKPAIRDQEPVRLMAVKLPIRRW
nr:prepilin-type cleavage/methylation domain-containing protein [Pectobacterium versatile]